MRPARYGPDVGQAEHGLEQLAAGDQPGAGVEQEEEQGEEGAITRSQPLSSRKRLAKNSGRVRASP